MDFITSLKTCFRKYFDFTGRARRSEFWWFYLFVFIIGLIPLLNIVSLLLVIPTLSAAARRLHDTDRSGWWQLAPLLPAVVAGVLIAMSIGEGGQIVASPLVWVGGFFVVVTIVMTILVIVWLASDTHPGPNRFGPPPK